MAELEKTSLWPEVQKILNGGQNPVRFEYKAILHTVNKDIDVLKVITIDIVRDYVDTIFDYVHIEFVMLLGDYLRDIYPYRTNLELTLTRRQLPEVGTGTLANTSLESIRYKAVFMKENKGYSTMEYDRFTQMELNMMDVVPVTLQLLDRNVEAIRMLLVNGIYKDITMAKLLKGVLVGEAQRALIDGVPALTGADIVTPSNIKPYKQLIIPNTKGILDIPFYLQESSMGVYNGGIGSYLQNYSENDKKGLYWFVYPIFDETRYDTDVTKLIIYSVPKTRLLGVERTYRKDVGIIHLLATSEKSYNDSGEADYIDKGIGFVMTDAEAMMKKPVIIDKKGPIADSNRLNYRVGLKDKEDGNNYAPSADRKISSNPYAQTARVLARAGGRLNLIWQNSNPDLIYPGMPVRYYYTEENNVKYHDGVVSYNHNLIQTESPDLYSNSHMTNTNLSIYVW